MAAFFCEEIYILLRDFRSMAWTVSFLTTWNFFHARMLPIKMPKWSANLVSEEPSGCIHKLRPVNVEVLRTSALLGIRNQAKHCIIRTSRRITKPPANELYLIFLNKGQIVPPIGYKNLYIQLWYSSEFYLLKFHILFAKVESTTSWNSLCQKVQKTKNRNVCFS